MAKPWQPDGHCHQFDSAMIKRTVPAVSGVYGLHTRHRQLFIGAAADLREALLRHTKDSGKLFRRRQPSYFSFEICETSLRANRVQALTAEYRPLIQAPRPLSIATPPSIQSTGKVMERDAVKETASAPVPQWPEAQPIGDHGAAPGPRYFSRSQVLTLGMSFLFTAAVSGFFGFMTGQKITESRQTALHLAAPRRPILANLSDEAPQAKAESNDTTADSAPVESETLVEKAVAVAPLKVVSGTDDDGEAPLIKAKKNLEVSARSVSQAHTAEPRPVPEPAAAKAPSTNTWSVQISATQERPAAQLLLDRLKSKGFAAYIVEAEINSGRWYRIRVGRFSTSQEAEKTRQDLQSRENLANAFVTAQ